MKFQYAEASTYLLGVTFYFSQGDDFVSRAQQFLGPRGIDARASSSQYLKCDKATILAVLNFLGSEAWQVRGYDATAGGSFLLQKAYQS